MSSEVSDQRRLLSFKADGKTDLLMPKSFAASERMSGLFNVVVELLTVPEKVSQVKPKDLLGKRMTLRVRIGEDPASGPYRYFDGICSRFASLGKDDRYHYFQAEVVPWAWLLTKRADCRVYQDLKVPEIVEKVCQELQADFPEFKFQVRGNRGNYAKLDYCVQFRETHFNFISRLIEQDGMYYYFEHTENGHTMIFDDSLSAGNDLTNQAEVRFSPESGMGEHNEDVVEAWRDERALHSGKFVARDYHHQMATQDFKWDATTKTSVASNDKLEMFDWPDGAADRFNAPDQRLGELNTEATRLNKLRSEAEEVTHRTLSGSSYCRGFTPGYKFHFKHAPGEKYLLTSIEHSSVQAPEYQSNAEIRKPYGNTFHGIPADVQFRPQRYTPKPVVEGLQSAVIVGPKGEEIYTDKYGRVRVQFFWDRKGKKDEKSTCWVRVAQAWAGKRWGASFWPRIGQEVVVAFLEGDPDQPVIVGSLYNNDQMPPYIGDGLDSKHKNDNKISGIKSNTTKDGDGFNEWRFDDTKDKQQVFIHAERDYDLRVKNESRELIINHSHLIVGSEKDGKKADRREQILQDRHMTVERNQVENVKGNLQLLVGGGQGDNGNLDLVTKKDLKELVGGDQHVHVKMGRNEKVDMNQSLTVGMNQNEKVGMNHALEAGMCIHLKAGLSLVLEAGVQLTLKVGGNFIDINPVGVFIQGTLVMINSGGAAGAGAGASPTSPQDAKEAAPTKPDEADNSVTGHKSAQ